MTFLFLLLACFSVCIPETECCRVCVEGLACGDTCISSDDECSAEPGCACDEAKVCEGEPQDPSDV